MQTKAVKQTSSRRSSKTTPEAAPKAGGKAAVEAYLARVQEPARRTLGRVRATIRASVPDEAEECISYGMPAFRYKGTLVAYAAFKNHCSFFPMQASLIDRMKDELADYRTAKGTLQFPLDKPLPFTLVKRMVQSRVAENERRSRA